MMKRLSLNVREKAQRSGDAMMVRKCFCITLNDRDNRCAVSLQLKVFFSSKKISLPHKRVHFNPLKKKIYKY